MQGSTKCNARLVTNVIDGVQKVVQESYSHNHPLKVARKKRSIIRLSSNRKIKMEINEFEKKLQTSTPKEIERITFKKLKLRQKDQMASLSFKREQS